VAIPSFAGQAHSQSYHDEGYTVTARRARAVLVSLFVAAGLSVCGATADASTVSQQNALRDAKQYLQSGSFSLKGLIAQVKYDGFSTADATYGATHAGANWNKEAVGDAKQYLQTGAFSLKGLIGQLEYDGFTRSQAGYGVANSNGNWDKEAAKDAREYVKQQAFSASGLVGQLEYDGFTASQAEFGAKAVGL
jgi:hypothetical protein